MINCCVSPFVALFLFLYCCVNMKLKHYSFFVDCCLEVMVIDCCLLRLYLTTMAWNCTQTRASNIQVKAWAIEGANTRGVHLSTWPEVENDRAGTEIDWVCMS